MNGKPIKKWVRVKSAVPVYAFGLVFLAWGVFSPIYKIGYILAALATALIAYAALDKLIPGRSELIVEKIKTGDESLDQQLEQSRETLRRFREMAAGDTAMRESLSRISEAGEAITREVSRDHTERMEVYTFFSYYLPTVDKLMNYYAQFLQAGKGENVREGKARIEESLNTVASAFEKLLDKLYKNEAMDIKTEIAVMEAMLKSEGLAGDANENQSYARQTTGKGGTNV